MTVLRLNFKNSPWSIPPAPACLLCSGFVACWLMWQLDLTHTVAASAMDGDGDTVLPFGVVA
jgi:hypothetical protein